MIDRTGIRYGRLVAKEYLGGRKWRCLCDCGNEVDVYGCHLTCGHTRSCGCLNLLHGETKTRLHSVWNEMIQRCENPNSQNINFMVVVVYGFAMSGTNLLFSEIGRWLMGTMRLLLMGCVLLIGKMLMVTIPLKIAVGFHLRCSLIIEEQTTISR